MSGIKSDYFDVIDQERETLMITEKWTPNGWNKYGDYEIAQKLCEMSLDPEMTSFTRDEVFAKSVIKNQQKYSKTDFYPTPESDRIINVVIPEGVRTILGVEIGQPNLRLCNKNQLKQCYRARVVALAGKFPGFNTFSSFKPVSFFEPDGVVCMNDMQFLIRDSIRGYPFIFPMDLRNQ